MFLDARDTRLFGCTAHRLRPAPAPLPKQRVSITASVGSGGRNLRPDVSQIQAALNAVDPADGGPAPKLAVDEICGPLTIGAIGKFQRRVLTRIDSRIDPHGPTLVALNARLNRPSGSLAFAPTTAAVSATDPFPDSDIQPVLDQVPTIRGALFLARSRIESVAPFVRPTGLVQPSGSGSERGRVNLELVDEVFRLSDFVNPTGVYQQLRFQFENMLLALRTCDPPRGVRENGLFLRNKSALMENTSAAYVARSGKFDREQTGLTEDNVEISTKRIYVTGFLNRAPRTRRDFIDSISHELAHFVSAPGFSVVDTLKGHTPLNQEPFRTRVYNRIANAENYGWFAWRSFEAPFTF